MKKYKILILPDKKEISVLKGSNLLGILKKNNIIIAHECGGKGICGKCRIAVKKHPTSGQKKKYVLACKLKVNEDLAVLVPAIKSPKTKILKHTSIKSKFKIEALVKREKFKSGFSLVLDNDELLKIDRKTKGHIFGVAVDVGTTTICASLCNLESGDELAAATVLNSQSEYGADIISRLDFGLKSKHNASCLSKQVLTSIDKAIDECILKSGVARDSVYSVVMVGNAVMHHLLFELPLESFITPPYRLAYKGLAQVKAKTLSLNINPNANVRFLPAIGGFVGSDVLGTILSLELYKSKGINLGVDLGTNGEIILGSCNSITVASCAAGPAFEGYNIKCGMVARTGAIEWIRINKGKLRLLTIGHIRPQGICGSGIIDITAELLKTGAIDSSGRMPKKSFLVYQDKKTKIEFTDRDTRAVQLAKAAICAGIEIMMKKLNIKPKQVKKVFLAGAFGNYLGTENAIRIGLIPKEFKKKIEFVGNTAFYGAKRILLSRPEFIQAIKLAQSVKHLSLAEDKNFSDIFTKALTFPTS